MCNAMCNDEKYSGDKEGFKKLSYNVSRCKNVVIVD